MWNEFNKCLRQREASRAGVCGTLPKTLTLFMTKIYDFPYPIYDLIKHLIPYLCIKTIFLSQRTGQSEDFFALNFLYVFKLYFFHRELDRANTSSH